MRPHADLCANRVGADRVARLVGASRRRTEPEEILLRVVAVRGPRLEHHAVVRQLRKGETPFRSPIPQAAGGRPQIERAAIPEEVAIAIAGPERETASGRQRAGLWIQTFAADDEHRFLFDEVHRPLEAAGRVGLQVFVLFRSTLSIGFGARRRLLSHCGRGGQRRPQHQNHCAGHGRTEYRTTAAGS